MQNSINFYFYLINSLYALNPAQYKYHVHKHHKYIVYDFLNSLKNLIVV